MSYPDKVNPASPPALAIDALMKIYGRAPEGNATWTEQLLSLYQIWVDWARLDGASSKWVGERIGYEPPPNPFSSEADVRDALSQHPICEWLAIHLPDTLAKCTSLPLKQRFAVIWALLSVLVSVSADKRPQKSATDKTRKADSTAISRVQDALSTGRIRFRQSERELLVSVLARAKNDLDSAHHEEIDHLELQAAARQCRWRGIEGVQPVAELAALLGVTCDRQTIENYVDLASRVWSNDPRGTDHHWSILPEIERRYRERAANR